MTDFLTLSHVSKELGISKSLLHHYRYMGLITPEENFKGIQIYNKSKITQRIKKIKQLQEDGKTLLEIQNLL